MKTFSVAVAVAVMLTFACLQESSAAPPMVKKIMDGSPVSVYEEIPEKSGMMSYDSVQMPRRCRFCCGCCPNMTTCGVCCRF